MKVNLAKTDRVVIRNKEGKVIANIAPGQITLHKGQQNILEIHEKQPTKTVLPCRLDLFPKDEIVIENGIL